MTMQTIIKWSIVITQANDQCISFLIYDNHYGNMLRKLNEISFELNPKRVDIIRVE